MSELSVLVFNKFPPVAASYHLYFSPKIAPEANSVAVDPIQIADPLPTGAEGARFTFIVIAPDAAGVPVAQVAFEVKAQATKSLFEGM